MHGTHSVPAVELLQFTLHSVCIDAIIARYVSYCCFFLCCDKVQHGEPGLLTAKS